MSEISSRQSLYILAAYAGYVSADSEEARIATENTGEKRSGIPVHNWITVSDIVNTEGDLFVQVRDDEKDPQTQFPGLHVVNIWYEGLKQQGRVYHVPGRDVAEQLRRAERIILQRRHLVADFPEARDHLHALLEE